MKPIRKEYPRIRPYKKAGNLYYVVDLRRKHYKGPGYKWFENRDAALKFAAEIASKVSQNGLSSISLVGVDPRIADWQNQFAVYGKTLEDAIEVALAVFQKEQETKESPYMGELLTVWVLDKVENKLKPLRESSIKAIRNNAEIFKTAFGLERIKQIDRKRIEDWLQKMDCSNQYKENLRNYLGQFYNWAKKKGHHADNPAEDIEITIARGVPEFFTVEQCKAIVAQAALPENRDMTLYFALCLFGGIRPEEVERMTWDNIRGTEIYLPAAITKTKKDRLFQMSPNLQEWIAAYRDLPLLVPESNIKNLRVKVCKELKFDWVHDGMRHTFSTFHYAKFSNLEILRKIMGNSPGVIERFYKGTIPADQVEIFWNIKPLTT